MNHKTKIRIYKFGMIFSGLMTVLLITFNLIIEYIIKLMAGIELNINSSSSVGIIGGADGPTAVYLATSGSAIFRYIFATVFFISTIICIVKWRKLRLK
ncbi:sodium ion-translocating decarboxylase subunit beta [Crassaminicella thermophila]|uniref:Sodium ion-translocating decarboxylase subunit beta n=1 Tax=Crassaminicella thermophila TaxID=2599308 RepID=A0A5C0SG87_CRATE|nr:sodium ion-translocating decarboxylase subunit beta [Crassaminicella thermophila]QEK12952.1 sodium ion-translocating decarboxylase subunit beta [Crassaminicella thermophila]